MSDLTKLNFNGDINQFTDEIARGLIGNVEDLQTEAKDSLVNALNEVDEISSGLNDEMDGVKRRLTSAEENIVHVTSEIGEMNQLKTTDKSTMVGAINEIFDRSDESVIGDLGDLTTTEKSTIVGAINEVNLNVTDAISDVGALETAVGDLADLDTTDKSSIVNAINEVADNASDERIGDLNDLTTTEKSTVVGAINEVNTSAENAQNDVDALETAVDDLADAVGDLADLDTTDKSSIVNAINEVAGNASDERIGDLNDLTTTEKSTVVGAINEVNTSAGNAQDDVDALETAVGDLADLDTTDKTSVVAGINEINGKVGNLNNLTTTAKSNLVSAINEVASSAGIGEPIVTVVADGIKTYGDILNEIMVAFTNSGESFTKNSMITFEYPAGNLDILRFSFSDLTADSTQFVLLWHYNNTIRISVMTLSTNNSKNVSCVIGTTYTEVDKTNTVVNANIKVNLYL